MALEQGTAGEYATWLLVLVGLWAIAAPFTYEVSGAARSNYFGTGLVVVLLASYVAYSIRE